MSSPAQGGPSAPKEKEEKKGFGKKVLSRMKTVLKKATDPSRRTSVVGAKPETTAAPAEASTRYAQLVSPLAYLYRAC